MSPHPLPSRHSGNMLRQIATALVSVGLLCSVSAAGAESYQKPASLRVCQDPNNMPFSNEKHEGIENRIAEVFGQKLGVPVEYFSFPQRLAFVRNTIRYKLPGEDYRCDVMLGVPQRFGQVSTTDAYYRSTYALVYRKGGKLDGVTSGAEFVARAQDAVGPKRLGIHDKSPAAAWLNKYNLTELARLYQMMSPDPDSYPGQLINRDLVNGEIDAAVVWGPVAGYYGKTIKDPELVVVPLVSEPGVRFDFSIAMGVRYGEPQWKLQIQQLINESGPEIDAILREFGVPLVDELGQLKTSAKTEPVRAATQTGSMKQEHQQQVDAAAKAAEQTKAAAKEAAAKEEAAKLAAAKEAAAKEEAAKLAAAKEAAAKAAAMKQAAAEKEAAQKQAAADQAAADKAAAKQASVADTAKGKPADSGSGKLYTVRDGIYVDENTLAGFKTWRAAACDRCHGANQEGLVGPSLIQSMKVLSKDEFVKTVRDGRLQKGMQSFGNSKRVMDNMDNLYAYLKGRSDGAITAAKVKAIQP